VNPDLHPDIGADLVIYCSPGGRIEGVGSLDGGRRGEGVVMVLKVIGIVVVAVIAFWILGALIEALMPILVIGAIGTGVYLLYKAVSGSDKTPIG
jgi:hypothetical protein